MIQFSTDDVHPRDRVAYWREVATRAFVRHQFRAADASSFSASIRAGLLHDLGVAEYECGDCSVSRTARDAARDDDDSFHLCLNLAGRAFFEQDGRSTANNSGGLLLVDMRRPFKVAFDAGSKAQTFTIPRAQLEARLGRSAILTARVIEAHQPTASLAAGFLAALPACLDALDPHSASQIAEQALDLIALAISGSAPGAPVTLSSAKSVALARLKAAIEANLPDPHFKPEAAAAAAGLSVRHANALLAENGTSLERHIMSRRLERCRRALQDPAQVHRKIADVALGWGFSDVSHFCRRFKQAYGFSPRVYRRFEK